MREAAHAVSAQRASFNFLHLAAPCIVAFLNPSMLEPSVTRSEAAEEHTGAHKTLNKKETTSRSWQPFSPLGHLPVPSASPQSQPLSQPRQFLFPAPRGPGLVARVGCGTQGCSALASPRPGLRFLILVPCPIISLVISSLSESLCGLAGLFVLAVNLLDPRMTPLMGLHPPFAGWLPTFCL